MIRLSISLLGSFQVTLDGNPVRTFESDKVRAMLAYLVAEAGQPHRRESLAGLLWPERPERSARQNLSQALYNLRQSIGDRDAAPPFLLVTTDSIQFNRSSDHWLDVAAFANGLAGCDQHDKGIVETCEQCGEQLQQAVSLYRGDFMTGFSLDGSAAFEEWVLVRQEQHRRQMLDALHRLAICYERQGALKKALDCARQQVDLDPWREGAHRQVMRLLALDGQWNAALVQYERCRRVLAEELGVEPESETTALHEHIREKASSRVPPSPARHDLPVPLTPFVGRETELGQIRDLLQQPACRLLTLVGPGGIGKSRLALEAARLEAERFPHGVYLVSLTPLDAVEAVVPAVVAAMDLTLRSGDSTERQLLTHLRRRKLLLILDNLEHLLDAARWVTGILRIAPDVKVMATSRVKLNVKGEHVLPVSGMAYPEDLENVASYSAVQLFLNSARRVRLGFEPTTDDWAAIAQVCQLVEGMPLGILLAASWAGMLTPAEIVEEMARGIDFLATDRQGIPERQQSIRAVLDHSWHLLTGREQVAFQALSVFQGGFSREAAKQVADISLRELMALMDKSLLQRTSTGQYELHDLVQQYAAERLAASPFDEGDVRRKHCAYYAGALERWVSGLKGSRAEMSGIGMEDEIENARQAWTWAAEQNHLEYLNQALEGMSRLYDLQMRYEEGEHLFQRALDRLSVDCRWTRARILVRQGRFCRLSGRIEQAGTLLRQGLDLLGQPELAGVDTRTEQAFALQQLGWIEMDSQSDFGEARRLFQQSLNLYQAAGDQFETAHALHRLGLAVWYLDSQDEAGRFWGESLAMFRSLGAQGGVASLLRDMSMIPRHQGRLEESAEILRESIAIASEIGNRQETAHSLVALGSAYTSLGKFEEAQAVLEESSEISKSLGDQWSSVSSNLRLGVAEMHLGRYGDAKRRARESMRMARRTGHSDEIRLSLLLSSSVALAREQYIEAQVLLDEGTADIDEIRQWDDWGWGMTLLVLAACRLGRSDQARELVTRALQRASEEGEAIPAYWIFAMAALYLADLSNHEQAVETYALASRHPLVAHSKWLAGVVGQHIDAAAATLPEKVTVAAEARGLSRDSQAIVSELLAELER
jgi:predicted ATPase/DNA-binding SARP family transcriptional activator